MAFHSDLGAVVLELLRIKSIFLCRHQIQTLKLQETCLMQWHPQILERGPWQGKLNDMCLIRKEVCFFPFGIFLKTFEPSKAHLRDKCKKALGHG